MAKRVANFYAGPSTMPLAVLKQIQKEFLDFAGSGMSVVETSHRSKEFEAVVNAATQDLREILDIPADYSIFFVQGGASINFPLVPMNFKEEGKVFTYLNTGEWSKKAIKEAKLIGETQVLASSEDRNFCYIPELSSLKIPENAAYLHITSNNTIFGTQFKQFPKTGDVPLIADMSSDFLSRPFNVKDFALIYAGAQKNVGPSGLAIVIARKDLLEKSDTQKIPTLFKYNTHAKDNSLYNTPNSFGIYMVGLVLKHLKKTGGLAKMQQYNGEKAKVLYDFLDESKLFKGSAEKDSRSLMNVPFVINNPDENARKLLEKEFLAGADKVGLIGLKGHRAVGGFRASIYNAMEISNVKRLVAYMKSFESKKK